MRYMFVGSFDEKNHSLQKIEANLKILVKTIFFNGGNFYLRDSPAKSEKRFPIDSIIYSALSELYDSDKTLPFKDRVTILYEGNNTNREDYADFCCFLSITNLDREQFYDELLSCVDIILGVTGSLGIMRLYMVCEIKRKPFIVLPGSNEEFGDLIANDFLTKSFQTKHIKPEMLKRIRSLPLLCHNYTSAEEIYKITNDFYSELMFVIKERNKEDTISIQKILDNYTIRDVFKKLTFKSWIMIIGLIISIITTTIVIHNIYLDNFKPSNINTTESKGK